MYIWCLAFVFVNSCFNKFNHMWYYWDWRSKMIFFTADLHLWNKNIIKYTQRPFSSYERMTEALISLQNETLSEDDTLFDLGDYSLKSSTFIRLYEKLEPQLKTIKGRHLILGNHDSLKPFTYVNTELFTTVHTAFWFEYEGLKFVLNHDPCVFQPGLQFDIGICGHVHKLFKEMLVDGRPVINVGVDVRDFKPISIEHIIEIANGLKEGK